MRQPIWNKDEEGAGGLNASLAKPLVVSFRLVLIFVKTSGKEEKLCILPGLGQEE